MTPDLLRTIGEALYGERWQSALAAALGVSDRTVRRWLSGADRPRPGVAGDLYRLGRQRALQLRTALQQLEPLLDPRDLDPR